MSFINRDTPHLSEISNPSTFTNSEPLKHNESCQSNGRQYAVVHSESGLIGSTQDKNLKSSINEIHQFVNQNLDALNSDQLKHLQNALESHISSLNGRGEKLVKESKLLSKMPRFLQNFAKKFADVVFKGVDFAKNEGNQKMAEATMRMLEKQLPVRETTERNIHKIADQIRAQGGNLQSTEVAKALATLQMQQISPPEKQAALMTIKAALKESLEQMKNGNPEGAEKAAALLKQTHLLFHQTGKNASGLKETEKKINEGFLQAAEDAFTSCQPEQVDKLAKQLRQVLNPFKDRSSDFSKSGLGIALEKVITKKTWERFDDLKPTVVKQTGNIAFGEASSTPPVVRNAVFNNYGLRPDPGSVKYQTDGSGKDLPFVASFSFNGKEYDLKGSDQKVIFDRDQGMLFNQAMGGSQVNYDQVNVKALNSGAVLMTLCDGCGQSGGALRAAKRVLDLSEENAEQDFNGLTDSHSVTSKQLDRLQQAQRTLSQEREEIEGDTTFVQAYIQGGVLSGVAVGDAKLFVIRPDSEGNLTCIDLTKDARALNDATDSGGRFCGNTAGSPELDTVRGLSFPLEKGDIVMVSSDGVADCFDPHTLEDGSKDIETNMASLLKGCRNSEEMQQRIEAHLQSVTVEEKLVFLTSSKGKVPHQKGWGKMDNANMGFFTYQ